MCCYADVEAELTALADELAHAVDLDLRELRICRSCLSFVSVVLERGSMVELQRTTALVAEELWHSGLALPVQATLERARRRGIRGAQDALANVRRQGASSPVVHALVRRLGRELGLKPTRSV
jgi:hypothetical protein